MYRKFGYIILLCTVLLSGMSVFATQNPTVHTSVDYATNQVTIYGEVADGSTWVTCYVISPDDYLEYTGNTAVTDETFSLTFTLTHIKEGLYKVYAKAQHEADFVYTEFVYVAQLFEVRTVGHEYEQSPSTASNLSAPEINSVHITVLNHLKGIYRLEIQDTDFTIDSRGTPFFFWRTTQGTFTEVSENYRSVTFQADPGTRDTQVRIMVGLGDCLGQTNYKTLRLKGNDLFQEVN
ncbi:hypothetical protein [Ructibacterium gallinarum]|uniref:Ig-like domain-containing protein n=1 Tax=Ructibacterium gallinarum TaxID=2779355 RepID=A0A9D5M5M0_9FIRM|nr:hypothetical protein [Ructibacterium gallinarum]MBE5041045.1 hypothetical protein [Ructibacterium gallinarum]